MAVELKPRIVVIGVGGAGGNAVNNMIEAQLQGVEFMAANTDAQALARSKAPVQLQLGMAKTSGLGAGANPELGAEAAKESAEEIKKLLTGAHMCFVAAGMGGGTGTGAAPIIARIAREQKVLTVGVVTKPFDFEGRRRMQTADKGIAELRAEVDTLIVIPNQNLFRIASKNTTLAEAFHLADQVLYSGVRSITDLMVMPGLINLDFADVRTVMAGMGTAMMGAGEAEGEDRALVAARAAVENPLLDDVSLKGAKGVIINITGGYDMTLFEVDQAANEIRREVDQDGHIILGSTFDENMPGKIRVSVVAAGVGRAERSAVPSPSAVAAVAAAVPAPEPAPAPVVAAPPPAPEPADEDVFSEAAVALPPEPAPIPAPVPVLERPSGPVIRHRTVTFEREEETELAAPAPQAETAAAPEFHAPPPPQPQSQPQKGLGGLFGWNNKRPAADAERPDFESRPREEEVEDDLEIPAFLRRSANT